MKNPVTAMKRVLPQLNKYLYALERERRKDIVLQDQTFQMFSLFIFFTSLFFKTKKI